MNKEDFDALPENMRKYYNYKEQMVRLKKALGAGFYLEAVFIEYAVMEDRLCSFLKIAGVYDEKKHWNITGKLRTLRNLLTKDGQPIGRYLTMEMLDSVTAWKDKRNPLTHALMKQELSTEILAELSGEGEEIIRWLNSKATSYRRYTERQADKNE